MAEPDTTTAPATDYSAQVQQLYQQLMAQPPAPTGARAQVARPSSITGLLGSALGGGPSGAVPMSADEADAAGNRSLLNFGLSMLANSGYSTQPRTFGEIFAKGAAGAQESMGRSEALTAARGQAQQDYAQSQQEQKLARIKEAIPILSAMQTQQRLKAMGGLPSPLSSNTNIGAAGASADVPAELMPIYQAAAARTGIPVEVLIAQHKQESGFNNALTGNAGEIGIGQIKPSTAEAPGYGMAPVDPKALRDPATNINFAADYLRARMPKGANPSDPAVIEAALKGYNGGGDPNYVANVKRYLPGAKPTVAGAPASPTTPPPPPPRAIPSDQLAPAASGGQVAGPGAPSNIPIQPAGPAVPGDVGAIIGGMTQAGADPNTLAATGRGMTPAPNANVAGPATPTPPPAVPQPPVNRGPLDFHSLQDYQQANPFSPPDEIRATFATTLPPDELARRQAAEKSAETVVSNIHAAVQVGAATPADEAKAVADLSKVRNDNLQAMVEARKTGNEALRTAHDKWLTNLESSYNKAHETEQAFRNDLTKSVRADDMSSGRKVTDAMDAAAVKSNTMNSQLTQIYPALANLPQGLTASVLQAHPEWLNGMKTAGIVSSDTADAVQMLNELTSYMATEMKPAGLGSMREYEFDAFRAALPTLLQSPDGQKKALAFLLNMNDRIIKESQWMRGHFNREIDDPSEPGGKRSAKNMAADNFTQMDKALGPVLPHYEGDITDTQALNDYRAKSQRIPGRPYYDTGWVPGPDGKPSYDSKGKLRTREFLQVAPMPGAP
jgi:soluble lytic murein transglycosylase-like protein